MVGSIETMQLISPSSPPSFYGWGGSVVNGNASPRVHQKEEDGGVGREEKIRCEWDFRLCTVISHPYVAGSDQPFSDALGPIEFDPSDRLLATGGLSRKIRIYTQKSLIPTETEYWTTSYTDHTKACGLCVSTPAKLSSLRWKPGSGSRIVAAGDYDGVVTEYDLEKRVPIAEREEHGGRKVWSVDYSHFSPQLAASGSDDGSAQIWDTRRPSSFSTDISGKIFPGESKSPVCSVEFDPHGGRLIGVGSADRKAYVYDLRKVSVPVSVFCGHRRTVTYVRFVRGGRRILSASTDGSIKMWDSADATEVRTYEGHKNEKSFVGLSVLGTGGLVGCGSESSEVYVYDTRWGEPVWVQAFQGGGDRRAFVSGVCWSRRGEDDCMLVAGGSNGVLQVSVGKRK